MVEAVTQVPAPDAEPSSAARVARASAAWQALAGPVTALLLGVGLSVCAEASPVALLVAVAIAQGVFVISWVLSTGLPGRIGAAVIGAMATAAADTVMSVWPHGQLGTLVPVVALAVPVMFVHQLTRGVVRVRVVESLSDIALLAVVAVAFAALIQLRHEVDGRAMLFAVLLITGSALLASYAGDLVWAHPRFDPDVPKGLFAVVIATAVGALVGYLRMRGSVEFNSGRSAFLGASVGAVTALFAVGAAFMQHASSLPAGGLAVRLRPVFAVAVVFGLAAPASYLLCLAIRG